ncbi:hypothetical protein BDZ91DRAFT_473229 [Kalaharituber pfeilii]|nr:hypothetical protein BDZ91DRAFT_473229 [Kalaharituber pfeilii]
MVVDVYKELMKNIVDVDFSTIEFKYQRGAQVSRQTLWRHKKAQQNLQHSATGCRQLTAYFTTPTNKAVEATSSSSTDIILEPKSEVEMRKEILLAGVRELRKKLKCKKEAPVGQNYQRHLAVLHFLQLQLHRPLETRTSLSLMTANSFDRGTKMARHLRQWERSWLISRSIPQGFQGLRNSRFTWLDDEGVQLAVREYIANVGEALTTHGLAKAITEYLRRNGEEEEEGIELENILVNASSAEKSRSIKACTARRWLRKLSFRWRDIKKGVYIDGHEREDVVQYRQLFFLPQFFTLLPSLVKFTVDSEKNTILIQD